MLQPHRRAPLSGCLSRAFSRPLRYSIRRWSRSSHGHAYISLICYHKWAPWCEAVLCKISCRQIKHPVNTWMMRLAEALCKKGNPYPEYVLILVWAKHGHLQVEVVPCTLLLHGCWSIESSLPGFFASKLAFNSKIAEQP